MEQFFGDVYYEVVAEGESDPTAPAMDAYRSLLRLYTRTLAQTTSWFFERPLGALGRWFRLLIKLPDLSRLTVIRSITTS